MRQLVAVDSIQVGKMEKFNGVGYEGVNVRKPQNRRAYLIIIVILSVLLALAVAGFIVFAVLYVTSSSDDSNDSNAPSSSTDSNDSNAPSSSNDSDSSVCETDACFDLSVQIKGAMDERVDPCEDFYNFTCGNWDIYNGIRPGHCIYNTYSNPWK